MVATVRAPMATGLYRVKVDFMPNNDFDVHMLTGYALPAVGPEAEFWVCDTVRDDANAGGGFANDTCGAANEGEEQIAPGPFQGRPLPSVTEGDYTLGILHDMGEIANWASEMYQGYLMAIQDVNNDPSFGFRLGYIAVNTNHNPDTTEQQAAQLLAGRPENNMVGIIGAAWTVATKPAAKLTSAAMVPMISSGSQYMCVTAFLWSIFAMFALVWAP